MTVKQLTGSYSSDGSIYSTITDGAGNLVTWFTDLGSGPKLTTGHYAPDGSIYITLTDGAGNLV